MSKLLALCMLGTAMVAAAQNPLARPEAVVTDGNARFTVLTPEIIRIEYSPEGKFEDKATFVVVNRDLPVPEFTTNVADGFLTLKTADLELRYRQGTDPLTDPASPDNLTITMHLNGEPVVWYPGLADSLNLKGTCRTLDRCNGDSNRRFLEDGLVSRSGWAVINDSPSAPRSYLSGGRRQSDTLTPDGSHSLAFDSDADGVEWVAPRADDKALDLYFMGYGHNYKKALQDFTLISGKIPLPPDYVFGYWYSRYSPYTSDDYRDIMKSLADNGIKTDVMILDMDWHWNGHPTISDGKGGWTGWSWNTNLIPDPEGLLTDIHNNGLKASLNLHPADGVSNIEDFYAEMCADMGMDPAAGEKIPWMLENKDFYRTFFNHIIRTREKEGVDFWWLDWQQHPVNPRMEGLSETFWCNHVFFNDMKKNRPDRRPVIFHRWGGLGSHRYQIGFSGDTYINFPTLAFQPYFTATASNEGYGYWGHDLGGHLVSKGEPTNDPELVLRWIQYGVFTPIFRTHASANAEIERRIWLFENFPLMRDAVDLRYALFPYIYTMARKSYDTGVGICRPLYYEYPEVEEAYAREDEYFFGDDILVAPIVTPGTDGISTREIWFPEGYWWSPDLNKMFKGAAVESLQFTQSQIPWFIRRGGIVVMNPSEVSRVSQRPDHLIIDFVAGQDGATELYEDSGDSNDYDTNFATMPITQAYTGKVGTYTIGARHGSYEGMQDARSYTLRILNADKPAAATLDGKALDVTYDAATRTATVEVPKTACTQQIVVKVTF